MHILVFATDSGDEAARRLYKVGLLPGVKETEIVDYKVGLLPGVKETEIVEGYEKDGDNACRSTCLDGKKYNFGHTVELESPSLSGEYIRFPPAFPNCNFLLVSDPHHERILVHLFDGYGLYAYYPYDCSFKILSRNVCPWSDVLSLVDEVLYIYDPSSAHLVNLSAFDVSDGAKSLCVVWATKSVDQFQEGVYTGTIYLKDYVFKAMFHVGNNTFWFANWSPDNLGDINMSFVKFKVRRMGDNITCTPFDFLTRRLESALRVLDVVLPEVMVSTLPHIDAEGFAPVPLSLDRRVEMESIVDLIDHLLILEATWHEGKSLEVTLHSCIYLQRLDSFKDYNLLYPILRITAASYPFAASDEERISLGSCDIGEEVWVKLQSLEDYLLFKKGSCGDHDMEALYETCLQRVKFRKFLYFALRSMSNPIGQGEVIKGHLKSASEALLQFSVRTTGGCCDAVGFREWTEGLVSWTEMGAIQIAVDIHNHKPIGTALKHLLNMIVQDGKLYGRVSMLSAALSTCCSQRNLENHPLVKTETFVNVGKLVLDMLKVLCQDLKTQRDSLLRMSLDWGELEPEMRAHLISAKEDRDIISDVGYFILIQAVWTLLRYLTLGFDTSLYENSREYRVIYLCMIRSHEKLLGFMDAGEEDCKFVQCHLNLSRGLLEVLCYLRDQVNNTRLAIVCDSEGNIKEFRKLRQVKAEELSEKRFNQLVKNGFDYGKTRKEIREKRVTLAELIGSRYFRNAYRLAKELEAKVGPRCEEARKLKRVAKRNWLAVKRYCKIAIARKILTLLQV